MDDTSFRFTVAAYNHTIPKVRQKEVVEDFKYMGLRGKIDLKTPDIIFNVFEECMLLLIIVYSSISLFAIHRRRSRHANIKTQA